MTLIDILQFLFDSVEVAVACEKRTRAFEFLFDFGLLELMLTRCIVSGCSATDCPRFGINEECTGTNLDCSNGRVTQVLVFCCFVHCFGDLY